VSILRIGESQRIFGFEDEQQAIIPLVRPADQSSKVALQGFRGPLEVAVINLHHVTDFVDEQADRTVICSHDEVDGLLGFGTLAPDRADGEDQLP